LTAETPTLFRQGFALAFRRSRCSSDAFFGGAPELECKEIEPDNSTDAFLLCGRAGRPKGVRLFLLLGATVTSNGLGCFLIGITAINPVHSIIDSVFDGVGEIVELVM
jgi:hypothetical protein